MNNRLIAGEKLPKGNKPPVKKEKPTVYLPFWRVLGYDNDPVSRIIHIEGMAG